MNWGRGQIHRFRHLGSGMAMGLAALFPGISAGTVALLIGIHGRFIHAIANIDHKFPVHLWRAARGDPDARVAVRRLDLAFLGIIIAGMLLMTFSGAKAVTWLHTRFPGPLMAVFLGLIIFGALIPWRRIQDPGWREAIWLIPGVMAAVSLALAPEGSFGTGAWRFFIGGLIAMPMMILPGVSGSALLVTIGLYADAFAAVDALDIPLLLMFLAGGVIGIITSAKALNWLLVHHHGPTMAFLTGLLAGSVLRVWPWRTEPGFAAGLPAAPDHDLWWLVWTALAATAVLVLERWSRLADRRATETVQGTDDERYQ